MLEGGGMRLVNLHPSDEGEYECRAENRMGSAQASVRVIVQERPVLTVTPETRVQVSDDQNVGVMIMWSDDHVK